MKTGPDECKVDLKCKSLLNVKPTDNNDILNHFIWFFFFKRRLHAKIWYAPLAQIACTLETVPNFPPHVKSCMTTVWVLNFILSTSLFVYSLACLHYEKSCSRAVVTAKCFCVCYLLKHIICAYLNILSVYVYHCSQYLFVCSRKPHMAEV